MKIVLGGTDSASAHSLPEVTGHWRTVAPGPGNWRSGTSFSTGRASATQVFNDPINNEQIRTGL